MIKKIDKERKAAAKSEFGYDIINASDQGVKRKKTSYESGSDDEDECERNIEVNRESTAAYRRENKVPVPHPATMSRKRVRARPPKRGHILSSREVRGKYPDIDLRDNSDDDSEDDIHGDIVVDGVSNLTLSITQYFNCR